MGGRGEGDREEGRKEGRKEGTNGVITPRGWFREQTTPIIRLSLSRCETLLPRKFIVVDARTLAIRL